MLYFWFTPIVYCNILLSILLHFIHTSKQLQNTEFSKLCVIYFNGIFIHIHRPVKEIRITDLYIFVHLLCTFFKYIWTRRLKNNKNYIALLCFAFLQELLLIMLIGVIISLVWKIIMRNMLTLLFQYLELRFKSKAAKLTGTTMMILQQVSLCNRPEYLYDDSTTGASL